MQRPLRTTLILAMVLLGMLALGVGLNRAPSFHVVDGVHCDGVCPDGEQIQVHGTIYPLEDDDRPACFVQPTPTSYVVVYVPNIGKRGYVPLSFEVACP